MKTGLDLCRSCDYHNNHKLECSGPLKAMAGGYPKEGKYCPGYKGEETCKHGTPLERRHCNECLKEESREIDKRIEESTLKIEEIIRESHREDGRQEMLALMTQSTKLIPDKSTIYRCPKCGSSGHLTRRRAFMCIESIAKSGKTGTPDFKSDEMGLTYECSACGCEFGHYQIPVAEKF